MDDLLPFEMDLEDGEVDELSPGPWAATNDLFLENTERFFSAANVSNTVISDNTNLPTRTAAGITQNNTQQLPHDILPRNHTQGGFHHNLQTLENRPNRWHRLSSPREFIFFVDVGLKSCVSL